MQFDKEESDETLMERIIPLMREKNYKDVIVLVRKVDFLAGNQNMRYVANQRWFCFTINIFTFQFLTEARGALRVCAGLAKDISPAGCWI